MSWSQALVVAWIQFAGAALLLLLAARIALRWVGQPVERIRLIQLALAAALAVPGLIALAPWPAWRLEVVSPAGVEPLGAAPRSEAIAAKPPLLVSARHEGIDTTEGRNLPLALSPPARKAAERVAGSVAPAVESNAPEASPQNAPARWDAWTWAALALLALHALAAWFFVLESAIGVVRLRRLYRNATAAPAAVLDIWNAVTQGRGRRVRVLVSSAVETPLAFGWLRPCVILPRELAVSPSPALRPCLAHEWSHISRGDLATCRFAWFCQFAFWPQPLFWKLWSELRICQDMVADADSTRAGQNAIEYSELLLDFAKRRRTPALGGALRFVDRPSHLTRRITMLLQPKAPLRSRCSWKFSLASLLASLAAVVLASCVRLESTQADEERQPPAAAPADSPQAADRPAAKPSDKTAKTRASQRGPQDVAEDELAGVVVDENGQPLAGVTVDAWHWHPGNETQTDKNGQFRLKGLDSREKVEVLISKEGYTPEHFAQRPTGAKDWVIVLGQKTYLAGTIVGADGQPAANAEIRASFGPVQGDGVMISEVTFEGKSRADGSYRLYVPPRVYDVQVSAGERGVYRQTNVAVQENEAKTFSARLQPGVRFEARVVDSVTGEPVEDFILWQWRPPRLFARSDAAGKIVFEGLIPGKIEFNCGGGKEIVHASGMKFYQHGPFGRWWSPDALHEWQRFQIDDRQSGWQRNFDRLEFDLRPGMDPVTIVVEKGVTVTGRVTDPQGQPVEGATVAPARTGSGNSLTGDTRYSVPTDKDGRYQVVLPASNQATYNLVVHDGEYNQWRNWANGVSAPMQTTPGQTIEGLDLQLTEPATIRGRVTMGGRPVARRDVRAHAFDKLENRYYDPTTQTQADGTFELMFVRPGKHYVQVAPFWLSAEQAPQGSKVLEVKAGEVLEGIELHAAPEPKEITPAIAELPFSARVLDATKKPVAETSVALGALGGLKAYLGALEKRFEGIASESRTDEQGQAPLTVSVLGQTRQNASLIYAVDPAGKRAGVALLDLQQYADANPATPPAPIDVTLQPAAQVKLHVSIAETKGLLAQPDLIYVLLQREGLPLQQTGLTGPGTCEVLLPPGTYRVSVYSPGFAEAANVEFPLEAGQKRHEQTIELSPTRVARLIGQPAPEFQQIKPSPEGKTLRLEDLKGKVVVLDFWGAWCGPCIAAMPNLVQLHDEYHRRGVEFIAIHDDSFATVEELNAAVAKLQAEQWNGRALPFPVLLDGGGETPIPGSEAKARGATTAAYGVTAFPTTLTVDRTGKVRGQIQAHDLDAARQKLDELLAEPQP